MSVSESMARHPGDAEAHAAGEYLSAFYGSPAQGEGRWINDTLVSTYAIGDSVNVAFADGHRRCVVLDTPTRDDGLYHVVEHLPGGGRRHHTVEVYAIAPF
jgi:prepilin-type processing-associated H-X9-DG protein